MNPNLCQNGKCDNVAGSFACRCEDGYSVKSELGPGCTDDDECTMGTFHCDQNAECINVDGTYDCRCRDGFTGKGDKDKERETKCESDVVHRFNSVGLYMIYS